MVVRILLLFLSIILFVNLCLITACYITGQNIYIKYGRQILTIFCSFVFAVSAFYVAIALIGLK